jgi:hypothetical protein
MNDNDSKVLEALRGLAADGPREAPVCVEYRLLSELRRRSHARRRNRWLGVATAAIAAGVAAVLVVVLWVPTEPAVPAPRMAPTAVNTVEPPQTPPKAVIQPPAYERSAEVAINFYQLPDADELPPIESATIVRVQLPMSSLRLMGLPVSEDRAAEFIQADMLLGQDGLARGVRFVQ